MRSPFSVTCYGIFLAGGMFALSTTAKGATRIATSLSQPDVQKTIDAAGDGDTVVLPAGTATWTTGVTVTDKFLTITGAGIDRTTLIGGEYCVPVQPPTHRVFTINAKRGGLTRLTGLTIDGGTGAKDDYNKGTVAMGGDSTTWRIDHVRVRATRTCAMHVSTSAGVIDHCRIVLVGWTLGIYGFNGGGGYGDAAWAEETELGRAIGPSSWRITCSRPRTGPSPWTAGKASAWCSDTTRCTMP